MKKKLWPTVIEEARTLPRFDFIAKFVAFYTSTKSGRVACDGMHVKKVGNRWAYGFHGLALFPATTADKLYDSIRRTPLNFYVQQAEETREYAHTL